MSKKKPDILNTEELNEALREAEEQIEKELIEFKYCTNCGVKKSMANFDKDKSKEDGKKDTCKDCRKLLRKQYKENTEKREIQRVEEEGMASLAEMSSGGSFDPHLNEVFEAMMRPFGGVNGWARHLFATYMAAEAGSQKRVKIHEMMMSLANRVTKLGLAERQLDMMEERDLLQVMRQHISDYQKGNKLSSDMVPTLQGGVVRAESWESKSNG